MRSTPIQRDIVAKLSPANGKNSPANLLFIDYRNNTGLEVVDVVAELVHDKTKRATKEGR